MTKFEQLDTMLEQGNGYITTRAVTAQGISKPYFAEYARSRELERVAHGVYQSRDAWPDDMYVLHLRNSNIIFSHQSALALHGMMEREPHHIYVTVKQGYNATHLRKQGVIVHPHLRIRHRRADAEHIRPETNPIPVSFRMEEYIMKKLSKRFLTLAIACVMAMAMAVPTFAAAPKRAAYAGVTYTILSKSNGLYASAQDGTNVQLASYAQKWTPVNDGGTIKLFRGTGNASKRVATYDKGEVILQASTCDYQVASIDFRTVSGQVHRIIFDQRNAYWNAIGTNIKTSWYNESSQAQLWTVNPA